MNSEKEFLYTDDDLELDVYYAEDNGQGYLYVLPFDTEDDEDYTILTNYSVLFPSGYYEAYFEGRFRKYDELESLAWEYLRSADADWQD